MLTQIAPILVTGGAGYIGSHAVLALLDAGQKVIVIDNLSTGFRSLVDKRAIFFEGDIGNSGLVTGILNKYRPKAILHFAGSIVVPESVVDPLKYYHNNSAKTCILLQNAVAAGVRHFLFSSTAATYGIPDSVPIGETQPTRPINPYGTSKLMTEMMLADVAAAHPLNYCALRYFNVAGADPHGRSGQSTAGATHLIKVAVEAATGKRDHISVFGQDFATVDGTGVRDYIHVSDLAAAHVHALALLVERPSESFILNCGYGNGYSVHEVLNAVERVTGKSIERRLAPRRAGDPDMLVSGNARILELTKWRPAYNNLEVIIGHAFAWEHRLTNLQAENGQPRRILG
jgi:UDP-glucose 4-epimerase